jgi:hypothetical protein
VADHPERWRSPFTQVEMREMWTYTDGGLTAKGYWWPGGTARAGNWVLVDQATGDVQGVIPAAEWSSATASELAACHTAMTLVAGWYRSGHFWVMPALGPSQDEVNRRLARADGLQTEQRASFETFVAQRGLNARSLAVGPAPGTPHAR